MDIRSIAGPVDEPIVPHRTYSMGLWIPPVRPAAMISAIPRRFGRGCGHPRKVFASFCSLLPDDFLAITGKKSKNINRPL